jgi:hypothetical protein
MKNIVSCPECGRALQVPEEFFGRTVQCPDCRHTFPAKPPDAPIAITSVQSEPSLAAIPAAAPPSSGALVPRNKRQPPDDDEYVEAYDRDDRHVVRRMDAGTPDRGGVILALGIVSLVLTFPSFIIYFLPTWLIPLVIGIFGWVMGQRDLRAIREGTMQQSGHVMTLIGMILSIVGVGISVCIGLFSCGMITFIGIMIIIAANAPPPPPRRF